MAFTLSEKGQDFYNRVKSFIETHIEPISHDYGLKNLALNPTADWTEWKAPAIIEELKAKAKSEGLWNLFLPDEELGAGLGLVDYAHIAELMGRHPFCSEIFNCSAPDTGNMEVLYHFGNDAQKEQWLTPLLEGKIRSVFCMTEVEVASSDATNMAATAIVDGDEVVLNGKKWWSTGIGHPNCDIAIFMGLTDPKGHKYMQHTMVLVPMDTPGVEIKRMLPTMGFYDPPFGHGEVHFNNVRVPKSNIIVGTGAGFMIAQGRLGPGRIHHCMRAIGAAEVALELGIKRGLAREAFGKPLINLDGNRAEVAEARLAIDQARLLCHNAAWKIEKFGVKEAMMEISQIKLAVPRMLQSISDWSMQIHGGAGLSMDTPLSELFLIGRALRYADGPDEVHRAYIARDEIKKYRS